MFDYVIVGAGSAGCVVASRLSEDPHVRVLLLEAGGSDDAFQISTPGLVGQLWRNRFDWTFFTTPQRELGARRMHWPRGKLLGGSSSINYMIYMRGHRDNYDHWRARGWGYEDVLPIFRKSEDNARGEDAYHGVGGPLHVSDRTPNPMSDLLVDAALDALSLPPNRDFNGAEQEGAGRFQATLRDGRRFSASVAFLRPARARPNLVVETGAHALDLTIERGRAVGVRYAQGNVVRLARAAREVIVSAGAIGSPHLLMLSGIGPADALRAHGIEVAIDLPGVGQNLQDHLVCPLGFEDKGRITANIHPLRFLAWGAQYAWNRTGPLASNVAESGAFLRSDASLDRPDIQMHFLPVSTRQVSFDEAGFQPKGHAFTIAPVLLYPESRGEIRLADRDPRTPPLIDPRYFAEPEDLRVLTLGVRSAQAIARSRVLERYRGEAFSPLCNANDDATLHAEIKRRCNTIFHPVGTCKMGRDRDAVVDETLRVRGIEGLRVADASIMPTIVGGNTNAPTIMIGEKAAEMIRA